MDDDKRLKIFPLRLSGEEEDAIKLAAERVGMQSSPWMRQILRGAAGLPALATRKERRKSGGE